MKIASEMTDQELNEWIAEKVMGWIKFKEGSKPFRWNSLPLGDYHKLRFYVDLPIDFHLDDPKWFNPTGNLNHAYLMEEMIYDLDMYDAYCNFLLIKTKTTTTKDCFKNSIIPYYVVHATARQKAEAAYIAFMLQ